jgi:hypothetical protein
VTDGGELRSWRPALLWTALFGGIGIAVAIAMLGTELL